VLSSAGLRLGMDIAGWPPQNIEEMAKKLEQELLGGPANWRPAFDAGSSYRITQRAVPMGGPFHPTACTSRWLLIFIKPIGKEVEPMSPENFDMRVQQTLDIAKFYGNYIDDSLIEMRHHRRHGRRRQPSPL